jgi:predicted RNA-binding Zn-ribbon protein involved in translation (DUF1610 family)
MTALSAVDQGGRLPAQHLRMITKTNNTPHALVTGSELADRAALELKCPRCGLSITLRARWLAVEHCPRCVGRARILVSLLAEVRPSARVANL